MGLLHMLGWYLGRYRTERRKYRKMMPDQRPITWLVALLMALMMAAIGLWVMFPPAAIADALYTVTVKDYCNVRERPDKDSADIGDLYAGDTVTGTGYDSGWVQVSVSLEQDTGWVRDDLLTLADYPTGEYTNSTKGRVRIRREPDGKHAAWLKSGGKVDVTRWVEVDGAAWAYTAKGYIDGTLLTIRD